jgi:hypothetical protein
MKLSGAANVVALSALVLAGCGAPPDDEAVVRISQAQTTTRATPSGQVKTLVFVPPGSALAAAAASQDKTPSKLSVFFPRKGQTSDGLCWQSLVVDAAGNVYPLGSGMLSKLTSQGQFVNGENDSNFFVTSETAGFSIVLDQARSTLFMPGRNDAVLSGPFVLGGVLTNFVSGGGLAAANEIALGRGPLAGNLFVTDFLTNSVYRVTIDSLSVSVFLGPSELLQSPQAIASAPDGTLYVVDASFGAWRLIKITPGGVATVFNDGTGTGGGTQARNMVAVDAQGTVLWSFPKGVARFRPDGTRLKDLPGPKGKGEFLSPGGAAFDSRGALYFVDNAGCKLIYRYSDTKK